MIPGQRSDVRPVLVHQRGDRQPQHDADRDVDREMKIEASLVEHGPAAERGNERVLGEARDAALVDAGKKAAGKEDSEAGMPDARERLRAGKAFAFEVDLGLVPHLEPAVAQCFVDLDPRPRARAHALQKRAPLALIEAFDRSGPMPGSRILGCHQHLSWISGSIHRLVVLTVRVEGQTICKWPTIGSFACRQDSLTKRLGHAEAPARSCKLAASRLSWHGDSMYWGYPDLSSLLSPLPAS